MKGLISSYQHDKMHVYILVCCDIVYHYILFIQYLSVVLLMALSFTRIGLFFHEPRQVCRVGLVGTKNGKHS